MAYEELAGQVVSALSGYLLRRVQAGAASYDANVENLRELVQSRLATPFDEEIFARFVDAPEDPTECRTLHVKLARVLDEDLSFRNELITLMGSSRRDVVKRTTNKHAVTALVVAVGIVGFVVGLVVAPRSTQAAVDPHTAATSTDTGSAVPAATPSPTMTSQQTVSASTPPPASAISMTTGVAAPGAATSVPFRIGISGVLLGSPPRTADGVTWDLKYDPYSGMRVLESMTQIARWPGQAQPTLAECAGYLAEGSGGHLVNSPAVGDQICVSRRPTAVLLQIQQVDNSELVAVLQASQP